MNIAIITARGGSKRIPRKNIKGFCGKPIICYSIEAALNAKCFDIVMVSTDDDEIAEIAKACGAEVPFMRSMETSNDFATTAEVINEVLAKYEEKGIVFELACCIYPTAPFVTPQKLSEAMELVNDTEVSTVMPVVAYSFPPQRAVVMKGDYIAPQFPEYQLKRSQDLEPIYHDAGQFYCFDVEEFKLSGKIIGNKTKPIVVSDLEVQDIDNIEDWKIAEMKYRLLMEEANEN